jgi:hypothetical protein
VVCQASIVIGVICISTVSDSKVVSFSFGNEGPFGGVLDGSIKEGGPLGNGGILEVPVEIHVIVEIIYVV